MGFRGSKIEKACALVHLVLWASLLFLGSVLMAQSGGNEKPTIDSLLNDAWAHARIDPHKGIDMLRQIEDVHTRQDTPYKADVVYYYYGIFYKNLNQFEESETWFNKYETFHEGTDNKWRVASVNMAKANLFSDKGDLPKSMEAVSKALRIYEEIQDTTGIIMAGGKMGFLLNEVGRHTEGLAYHRKANVLARLSHNDSEEVITYTNLALTFERQGLLDSALFYYTKAYALGETLNDSYSKVINRYNLANIHNMMGDSEASVPYVSACMELADSIDIPSLRAASRRLLADLRLQQGDLTGAIVLLDSLAGNLNYELGLKDQSEIYALLAQAHGKKGNYKTAFEHHVVFKSLSDSLLGSQSRERINELEIQYETAKREQRIAFLDLQNQTSQTLISQKDRIILVIALGLLVFSILSIILYVLIRKYLRQKKALSKALSDKDILLREIHHRVKNNLQIVSSLLSLQGRSIHDETALKAINEGKSRVRSMALIHQNLYQRENLTGVNVQEYIGKLAEELMHTYRIEPDKIELNLDVEPVELDVDTLVPLGLIVNELITNTLKYAFPEERSGSLRVSLKTSDNLLTLEVRDDGIGFDPARIRPDSFGQKLVRSLVKQLDGHMNIQSENGTAARLEVRKFNSAPRV